MRLVKRRRYDADLTADKRRTVGCTVSPEEHAAVRAAYPERGQISILVRDVISALAETEFGETLPMDRRAALSAQLHPEEIALLAAAGRACAIEPTTLLRLLVTARAGVGTGDTLFRLLSEARKEVQSE